ncbi:MAG: hypothetical protein GX180_12085 [Enterococcus sp.]|nr:hypothetical protein [Enterococcus sp.]
MGSYDIMGGITLAPLIILIAFFFFKGQFYIKDKFVRFCLLILIITNFLGFLIKNPSDKLDLFQSVILFSGLILTFIFIQNFKFSMSNIKSLFQVLTFISLILFVVALNQKYVFIDSPYLLMGAITGYPSVSSVKIAYDGRFPSLFGDYELFSEFSLLMFILAFSIFMDKNSNKTFDLGNTPFFLMVISFMNILITGTRSGFILLFAFVFLFFLLRTGTLFSGKTILLLSILIIMIPLVINFGDLIGFDVITRRMGEIDMNRLSTSSLVTGEQLNRTYVYAEGHKRLAEDSWILGYGYGKSSANSHAWLGNIGALGIEIRDFHSLYLSLPMIYGWIGGIAYLLLILYVIIKILMNYLNFPNNPIGGLALGFSFIFIFFLINELKINSLRTYNYHFFIWILIGISLSVNNYKSPISEVEKRE